MSQVGHPRKGIIVHNLESRPSFESIFMGLARDLSLRSTCSRLQVGCVITSTDYRKVISVGYNGGAVGQKNECDSLEPGKCGHLHAEENAIINCDVPRGTPKVVFCTTFPCPMCAKRFVNLGNVQSIYYAEGYRDMEPGKQILLSADIELIELPWTPLASTTS